MSEEFHAVAIIFPTPGKEDRIREKIIELGENVKENQPGVLKYQIFEQFDSQTGTNVFLLQEKYLNQAAAQAHVASPHFIEAIELMTTEGLATAPLNVMFLKPIGGYESKGKLEQLH